MLKSLVYNERIPVTESVPGFVAKIDEPFD